MDVVKRYVLLPFSARCDNQAEDRTAYDTEYGTCWLAKLIQGTQVGEASLTTLATRPARSGTDRIADAAASNETDHDSESLFRLSPSDVHTRDGVPGY